MNVLTQSFRDKLSKTSHIDVSFIVKVETNGQWLTFLEIVVQTLEVVHYVKFGANMNTCE